MVTPQDPASPHNGWACDAIGRVALATHSAPLQMALSANGALAAARWRNPAVTAPLEPPDRHLLVFHERGSVAVEGAIGSSVRGHGARIGSVTVIPAGLPSQWRLHGPCDVIHVYVDASRVCLADGTPARVEPAFARRDPWLQRWFGLLSAELGEPRRDGEPVSPRLADAFESLLVAHLLSGIAPDAHRGGLPRGALRRLDEFIHGHLGDELRLDDLAALAHLSSGHFIRAFRQSVGCTPWQYVLERRLDAAEPMLRQGMPAADVARRVGLVDAARLGRLVRQRRGLGLGDWRRTRGT